MLNNLKAEFVKMNMRPRAEIAATLKCSDRTAKNKLDGITQFSISEALEITKKYFPDKSIDYLFATCDK